MEYIAETANAWDIKNVHHWGKVLRGLIRDYQGWNRFLKSFTLKVFILNQLIVELYLLGFFDDNDVCVTIF